MNTDDANNSYSQIKRIKVKDIPLLQGYGGKLPTYISM